MCLSLAQITYKACVPSKLYHFYYYLFLFVSTERFSMINHQYVTNVPKLEQRV